MKMNFDEFKEAVVNRVLDYLPDSFKGSEVNLNVVNKPNNIRLTGLTIRKVDSRMAPTIYLEEFYSQFEAGENMGTVLRRIAEMRVAQETEYIDLNDILDFEKCRDKILPRLYGFEMNEEVIENRAYTRFEDFVVMYVVDLGETGNGRMSLPIEKTILDQWKITVEELHKVAVENQHKLQQGTFKSMAEVMKAIMYDVDMPDEYIDEMFAPSEGIMYVISNKNNMHGSSMILDKEFMDEVVDKIGGNFIVLPSSIHEVIVVPDDDSVELDYMEAMVYEINRTQVNQEDRLSDHVYRYSKDEGLKRAA